MVEQRKLFLIDAYAMIYRAYYALLRTPRTTSTGLNTSAIFGFCNTLSEVLRKENPEYIAVCFDPPHGATFRHEKYPDYKAGRDKQPEDITTAIPYIKRILDALRIPVVECAGYEADDVIGTLARRAAEEGFLTYMMTPDKDYGQLVTDNVLMYRPSIKGQGFEIRGPQQVCEHHGIERPQQVIDLLALEGDSSDNVPGCPGVGEKTAVKLLAEFDTVENLLAHSDAVKGALRTKIKDNAEQIRLSKWLVTICTDVPLEISTDSLRRREPDAAALAGIFKELEFNSLMSKFGIKDDGAPATEATKMSTPDLFDLVDAGETETAVDTQPQTTPVLSSPEKVSAFIDDAVKAGTVGLSLVADGGEAMTARPLGLAIAFSGESGQRLTGDLFCDMVEPETAYIPIPGDKEAGSLLMLRLAPLLTDSRVVVVSADVKRDILILRRLGIRFNATYYDTSVAHYVCNPEARHDLEDLAFCYLGIRMPLYPLPSNRRDAFLLNSGVDMPNIVGQRAAVALQLLPALQADVSDRGQHELLNTIELPFIRVLADMEWVGARINPAELTVLSSSLTRRVAELEEQAFAAAGRRFNIGSPSQVGNLLFDELKIDPKARKTKGGSWSTAEDALEKYASRVPLVRLILEIRAMRKLLATYVDALPKLINPVTGKIHTTYRQTVTATGRISSVNPNLQNIPVRTDDGREIRRAFVADPGDVLLSADYSQIELRLMAELSGDAGMTEAFANGEDIHRATAAKIYHTDISAVTDSQRRNAKTANFGIIYGISAFGLSERLNIPRAEAKQLIDNYMATYPGVAAYMETAIERARKYGYVTTLMGRRRYLPDINSRSNTVRGYAERNAINAPLQGSAADIIKIAMNRIHDEMEQRKMRSRMIMQVHDELIFNVKQDEVDAMCELVRRGMEEAYKGRVPLEVSIGIADNWLDAH